MAGAFGKSGMSVLEVSNRGDIQKINNESLSGITIRQDNHESNSNTNAHSISSIGGLSTSIANINTAIGLKANIFTGLYTTFTVVTSVNYDTKVTTTATLTFTNGILTAIS